MDDRGETRKIQFTGNSSYIISLPKQWVKDLGLKRGDQIRVVRDGSTALRIYPPQYYTINVQQEDATIEIDIDLAR